MIDGRLIEVTAIGELSLGWAKDGRRSLMISGLLIT